MNVSSQASPATRLKVWFESIPIVTRAVLAICTVIYAAGLLTGYDDLAAVCLSPSPVLWDWQVYRLLTHALFHVGLLHLAMNMLAFVPIGSSLERLQGSVPLLWLLLLLCMLGGGAYLAIAQLAAYSPVRLPMDFWHQCGVGLSGVIFGLVVIDTHLSGAAARSIFGFFTVPAKAYPWALLVVWQLLVPASSFLGHLCGVLVGQLYVWGALRWALLSGATVQRLERSLLCAHCYQRSGFIVASGGGGGAGASDATLPLSRPAAVDAQGSGWLRGSWMPFPTSTNPFQPPRSPQGVRLGSGSGPSIGGPGSTGSRSGAADAAQQQQQQHEHAPADPKAAAAAAAEARMKAAAQGGGSSKSSKSAPNLPSAEQ